MNGLIACLIAVIVVVASAAATDDRANDAAAADTSGVRRVRTSDFTKPAPKPAVPPVPKPSAQPKVLAPAPASLPPARLYETRRVWVRTGRFGRGYWRNVQVPVTADRSQYYRQSSSAAPRASGRRTFGGGC